MPLATTEGTLVAGYNRGMKLLYQAGGVKTAPFVATGQDIANVAESSAAFVHSELLDDGSCYYSITIPALIVATYGGGTGLRRAAPARSPRLAGRRSLAVRARRPCRQLTARRECRNRRKIDAGWT